MSLWLDRAILSFSEKQGKEGFNQVKLMRVNQLAPNQSRIWAVQVVVSLQKALCNQSTTWGSKTRIELEMRLVLPKTHVIVLDLKALQLSYLPPWCREWTKSSQSGKLAFKSFQVKSFIKWKTISPMYSSHEDQIEKQILKYLAQGCPLWTSG